VDPRSKRAQARANANPIPCEKLGHKRCRVDINVDGSLSHHIDGKQIREHPLVFQQYHKCCLLPGKAIRHINGINWDNRPENLEYWSKRARADQFGKYSKSIPENRRCIRCESPETRIEEDGREHWFTGYGDYTGGHLCDSCYQNEYQKNVVRAHRRVWEKHQPFPCCLVRWYECCFKNGNKKDIRIENLELFKRGTSSSMARRIPAGRRCMICRRSKTSRKFYPSTGHLNPVWFKKDGGYICNNCRTNERRDDDKRAADFDEYIRIIEMGQKMLFDPNFKKPLDQCAVCHSTTTKKRSKKKGGDPDWYRLRTGKGGHIKPGDQLQCDHCYHEQNRAKRKKIQIEAAGGPESYEQAERRRTARKRLSRDEYNALRRARRRALNESIPRYVPRHLQAPKQCADCGSTTTSKNLKGNDNWYRLEVPIGPIGYLDNNCYRRRERRLKREAKGLPMLVSRKGETHSEKRARLNALQWTKRRALKPEEPPEPPRRCIECGSYTTKIRKGRPRHPSVGPVWNRLGDRESAGGLYHCANCKELQRKRRVRRAQRLLKAKVSSNNERILREKQEIR
jgi:HNH endonuclease